MRHTRFVSFLIPLMLLGLAATLPILALAGTFQQVVSGEVTPEIDLKIIFANCGKLQVGKTYYWAGDEVSVEANMDGPTIGAKEVIETNVRCSLYIGYGESGYPKNDEYEMYRYVDVYDPETGKKYGRIWNRNKDAVTVFFDLDSQFGNRNEVELKEVEEATVIADSDRPLLEGVKLYLAITADAFGNTRYGGEWWIPIAVYARVI